MSVDMARIRETVVRYLQERGVNAAAAWPGEPAVSVEKPVAVVSVQSCRAEAGSFLDYLGERFDPDTGLWQELYGRRAEITFGLDLWAPKGSSGADLQALFEQVSGALATGGPDGLTVRELACDETEYDSRHRLLKRKVRAVCGACLYAAVPAGETFLDFELRGGLKA